MKKQKGRNYHMLISAFRNKFANQPAKQAAGVNNDSAINISETEKEYELQVPLPGYKKENLTMKVDDDILTIKAEHKDHIDKNEKKDQNSFLSSFQRLLLLPDNIRDDAITAFFKDEMLHILLPKSNHPVRIKKKYFHSINDG